MKRVVPDTRRQLTAPLGRFARMASIWAFCFTGYFAGTALGQQAFPGESPGHSPFAEPRQRTSGLEQGVRNADLNDDSLDAPIPISRSESHGSRIQSTDFSVEKFFDAPLVDVVIEGNATILPNAILRYIETRPGRPASPKQIQQDVARLHNTRWFLNVRPYYRETEAGPVLVFEVVERPILKSVTFTGNKKIKTGELEAHTGLRPGHGFDVAANRESVQRIKALYRERGYRFAEVTLEKGGQSSDREVVFKIEEGPKVKIWDINFRGNKFVSQSVLKTKLSSKSVLLWVIGGDYDPEIIRNDVMALKQYYMGLGFFDVEVSSAEQFSEDKGKVTVTFSIDEGQRYRVGTIDVVGNEVIPHEELLKKLKMSEGGYFNARFMREDVSSMKDKYDDLGRLFAKVEPTPHFRQDDSGWVDLTYRIDEDVPRYVGQINIHIRGDYPHTQEKVVRNQVDRFIKPGMLARGSDFRMAQARVRGSGLWEQSDPPLFDIVPSEGRDYLPTFNVRGQNPNRHELVETNAVWAPQTPERVFGHSLTPLTDQIREVPQPADPPALPAREESHPNEKVPGKIVPETSVNPIHNIDPDLIFRGQSEPIFDYRAQSLDRFGNPVPQDYLQRVSPQGDPFGDALSRPPMPGFVDVNIDVTEGRTGRLMFGVGVNSDAGVIGSLVLQEDNFDILRPPTSWADIVNGHAWRGGGQSFRLEAVPGNEVSRYMASWQDPFFLGSNFSLGLSGFYYNRWFRDWTEDRLGGRISLGYVLDRFWSVSGAVRLEDVNVRNFRTPAPQDLLDVAGHTFLSTASVTLSYDSRDNSFVPTRGNFADFTYEQGFGEFVYPRFDVTAGQYFTTYERPDGFGKHILALTGQLGWTGHGTPIYERYYAGGYSSFRGFEFRGVTPREMGFQVGGDWLMLGSAEYMVPLTADDNIRAVVFSDFGTVEPDVSLSDFRVTAGFGLRLVIPMMGPAPLAFDFAWPIVKQDFDRERVFSFYIGFTR